MPQHRLGGGRREEVRFDLWLPQGVEPVKGLVVISSHGSGETLFRLADLRVLAAELRLGLFKFVGNPMQRGFWPQTLLFEHLKTFGEDDHFLARPSVAENLAVIPAC